MDRVTPAQRSRNMSRVRGKDTGPELAVRRLAHRLGFRFRLHRKDLPGRPDLVFAKHRLVVFVHGCFWHRHEGCRRATRPSSRTDFWDAKFAATVARDAAQRRMLEDAGWRVLTLWECEVKDEAFVAAALHASTARSRKPTPADRAKRPTRPPPR